MKLGKWSWAYIPVAIVLGLIFYEFYKSGAFSTSNEGGDTGETWGATTNPGGNGGTPPVAGGGGAGNTGTPGRSGVGPGVAIGNPPPAPGRSGKTPPVDTPKPPGAIDDAFLNNPPPITVSFSNASFDSAIAALNKALGPASALQSLNQGGSTNQNFSIDMKNASFWEVFKAMNKQSPVDLMQGSVYGKDGLVLNPSGSGVYRFETNGPAILYPISINYIRQSKRGVRRVRNWISAIETGKVRVPGRMAANTAAMVASPIIACS